MAGILTQPHLRRLEALRRNHHLLQGEQGSISLLKRDSTQALVELLAIDSSWFYGDRDVNGRALPPWVTFELQVAEELIVTDNIHQTAAVQHGQKRFQIAQREDTRPGIFPPTGINRFWRFWLAPLEEVA